MTPRQFTSIADVRAAVGGHVGYSPWHLVDQPMIDLFGQVSGDRQWIHVDPVRAANGPFGGTIAHGYLTISLISMLVWEVMRIDGLSMQINYGLNKVRFPAPLPVDSRVRGGVELLSLEPFGEGHRLISRVSIERDGGERPVCVAESIAYLVP